ncbi:MAG TPA: thymidylate synthase [Planctomycetota bacterium]|nr:thymidylate synthase [Planctomycetota bacterium]
MSPSEPTRTPCPGNIPLLVVRGETLPEAWELALLAVWEHGADVRTEYDRRDASGKFIDPPSRDATAVIEVVDPFAEPRIHKNFPGGPEELEVYRQEVVEGIHDHWVDPADPDKWTYTYHERLFRYAPTSNLDDPDAPRLGPVDQMEYVVNKAAATHYSRRIQAITWMPTADPETDDPPCLQRLWFRLLPGADDALVLNLNSHWRSRDGYKAWFMNVFALTDLQRKIAREIAAKIDRPVRVGRYVDICDSFHIYGSYFAEFEPELRKMKDEPDYRGRAWPSDHPAVVMMFEETRRKIAENPDYMRI